MLRTLSAVGGDAFYLASDPAFAGADTHGTAQILRRCVDLLGGFDLILCGERTVDGETGQVAPSLAAMLDWRFAGYVTDIPLLTDGLAVCCQTEKRPEYPLPLVASVRRCCMLRYPGLQGLGRARHTQVRVLDAKALGGAGISYTKVVSIEKREVKQRKAVWYPPDVQGVGRMMEDAGIRPDPAGG